MVDRQSAHQKAGDVGGAVGKCAEHNVARCEMDLSPGTVISPRKGPQG